MVEDEKEIKLSRTQEHIILQALLWNSLFQIINQVFRCMFNTYELAHTLPGVVLVNFFWPLSFLAILVAGLMQTLYKSDDEVKSRSRTITRRCLDGLETVIKDQLEGHIAFSQNPATSIGVLSRSLTKLIQRSNSSVEERPLVKTSASSPRRSLDSLKTHSLELLPGDNAGTETSKSVMGLNQEIDPEKDEGLNLYN